MRHLHIQAVDRQESVRALQRLLETGLPRLRGEVTLDRVDLRFAWMPFGGPLTPRLLATFTTANAFEGCIDAPAEVKALRWLGVLFVLVGGGIGLHGVTRSWIAGVLGAGAVSMFMYAISRLEQRQQERLLEEQVVGSLVTGTGK